MLGRPYFELKDQHRSSKTLQRLNKKFQGLLAEKDALEKRFQDDYSVP